VPTIVEFPLAKTVSVEDSIASTERNLLARAINDRIRSGLGDGAWRIAYAFFSVHRQILQSANLLSPGAGKLVPDHYAQAWWGNVDPTGIEDWWPQAEPPETDGGVDEDHPLGGYAFGDGDGASRPWGDVAAEPDRLPAEATVRPAGADYDNWRDAAQQRGWIDPANVPLDPDDAQWLTKTDNAPFMKEAGQWRRFNYGGDPDETGNQSIDRTYGAWQRVPGTSDPSLTRQKLWSMRRMRHWLAREFRGSDAQRAEPGYWLDYAFKVEDFMAVQYLLAPEVQHPVESAPFYPTWETAANWDGDTPMIPVSPTVDGYDLHAGFVCCAVYVEWLMSTGSGTVRLDSDQGSITIPLTLPLEPNPSPEGKITVVAAQRLTNLTATLGGSGSIFGGYVRVQLAEVMEYLPTLDDLGVLLRMAGAAETGAVDGGGTTESWSDAIYGAYADKGGCFNVRSNPNGLPVLSPSINPNNWWEAARRFVSERFGIVTRKDFETIGLENGRTVMWFRRRSRLNTRQDNFKYVHPVTHPAPESGSANQWVVETDLMPYDTNPGNLWYHENYADQMAFFNRGLFAAAEFNDPGMDVRWTRHVRTLAEKTAAYNSRYEAPSMWTYAPTGQQGTVQPQGVLFNSCGHPDSPVDCPETIDRFRASNRIYEPPVEIALTEEVPSVEMLNATETGDVIVDDLGRETVAEPTPDFVKVTFAERVHHVPSAAADWSRYPWQWNLDELAAESADNYRTQENGLRQYAAHVYTGRNFAAAKGDHAVNTQIESSGAGYGNGSIYPVFRFVKLLPEAYYDDNAEQNPEDSPLLHDFMMHAEFMVRAMCEGFIDQEFPNKEGYCDTLLREWTYADLMASASGGRFAHLPPMPTEASSIIPAEATRPDAPYGSGPMPYTRPAAESFNALANAVNLLNVVRVPYEVTAQLVASHWASDAFPPGTGQIPPTYGGNIIWTNVPGGRADTLVQEFPPEDIPDMATGYNVTNATVLLSDSEMRFEEHRYTFAVKPESIAEFSAALPPTVADLLAVGSIAMPTEEYGIIDWFEFEPTEPPNGEPCRPDYYIYNNLGTRIDAEPQQCTFTVRREFETAPPDNSMVPASDNMNLSLCQSATTVMHSNVVTFAPSRGVALVLPLVEKTEDDLYA